MRFASPWFLSLLLLLPALVWYYLQRKKKEQPSLRYSSTGLFSGARLSWRARLAWVPVALRGLVVLLVILALARPQKGRSSQEVESEGIDILLALDISSSMKAEDFKPQNRLHVAKETIKEFIAGRKHDRLGLVVFARQAFTQCPLTLDYGVLLDFLRQVDFGLVEDGTAIGMGIITCVNRLKDSEAKSKIIILLTDGVNNAGEVDPVTAAGAAQAFGIRVYTIGVGRPGAALYPYDDPVFGKRYVYMRNEIDEASLSKIADLTGGRYFRARTERMLSEIYKKIDELEKTKIKVKEYRQFDERFWPFALTGLGFFLAEIFLAHSLFRRMP